MTPNEYQTLATRTICTKDPLQMAMHGVLGLQDEIGEFIDAAKEVEALEMYREDSYVWEQLHECKLNHAIKEIGDVWWMVAEIATANGLQLDDLVNHPLPEEDPHNDMAYSRAAQKLAGLYQKHFQGHTINPAEVAALLKALLKNFQIVSWGYTTLPKIWDRNIEKLKSRYPDGFESERSLHRSQNDV